MRRAAHDQNGRERSALITPQRRRSVDNPPYPTISELQSRKPRPIAAGSRLQARTMALDAIGARPVSSKAHGPSAALAVPAEPRYPLAGSGFRRLGPAPCKSGKKPKGPLCSPSRLQSQSHCFTHRGAALHSLAAIPKLLVELMGLENR